MNKLIFVMAGFVLYSCQPEDKSITVTATTASAPTTGIPESAATTDLVVAESFNFATDRAVNFNLDFGMQSTQTMRLRLYTHFLKGEFDNWIANPSSMVVSSYSQTATTEFQLTLANSLEYILIERLNTETNELQQWTLSVFNQTEVAWHP